MKKVIFILLIMSTSLGLMAQLGPKKRTPTSGLHPKGINIADSNAADLLELYLSYMALSKCDRYMMHYKQLLKTVLVAQPSQSNLLEISREITYARILYVPGLSGHIVFDPTIGSIPFPPIYQYAFQSVNGVFPVDVSSFDFVGQENGQSSIVGLAWQTGNYGDVLRVEDVYKIGTQIYADLIRSNGILSTIMIFPQHLMDGCQVHIR